MRNDDALGRNKKTALNLPKFAARTREQYKEVFDLLEEMENSGNYNQLLTAGFQQILKAAREDGVEIPAKYTGEEGEWTARVARRTDWTDHEKQALINEDGEATNKKKLDLRNTHYETQSAIEIEDSAWPFGI